MLGGGFCFVLFWEQFRGGQRVFVFVLFLKSGSHCMDQNSQRFSYLSTHQTVGLKAWIVSLPSEVG